ncbi:hypothetical protein [Streptomyces sp. NPDC058664]|uniref:hypothetical protein n=1 Tax=unclassified Streptomyces TaxID=2593676 RepID=UPI00364F93DB
MARTGPQRIPGAVFDLFFGDGRYSGSDMEVNCGVIHTTEGPTLYNYGGGASAPTVTSVPDFKNRRLVHHQHFDVDESARALVNKAGGVQTNQANAFQWELVGTCDPATHRSWTSKGIAHIYWPEPPDWAVRDVAALMRWLHDNHGIPLTGRSVWLAYPASYGDSPVRMSFADWTSFTGWCGHQHVPENDHGDPGALPFARILAVAKGDTAPPEQEDDMTPEERKLLVDTAAAVRRIEAKLAVAPWTYKQPGIADQRDMNQLLRDVDKTVKGLGGTGLTPTQIDALSKKLADQLAARLTN